MKKEFLLFLLLSTVSFTQKFTASATIIQHEIDHLSGILISDKIEDQKKKSFEKIERYRIIS